MEHEHTKGLYGQITHTELSSTDPEATRAWCADVLGWQFQPPFPTPAGEYHLYTYAERAGGGIRWTGDGEQPGVLPFVHVEDTQESLDRALAAGAEQVAGVERIAPEVSVAVVRAPGGVMIGLSGP